MFLDWWAKKNDLMQKLSSESVCFSVLSPIDISEPAMKSGLLLPFMESSLLTSIAQNSIKLFMALVLSFIGINPNCMASQAAARCLPLGLKPWRFKFSFDYIGAGNQLQHYDHQDCSDCSLHGTCGEKVSCVFHCRCPWANLFATSKIKTTLPVRLAQEGTKDLLAMPLLIFLSHLSLNLTVCASS